MNATVRKTPVLAHYTAEQVSTAIEHHARLNRRAISVLSIEFSEDASRTWTVTFADESRVANENWIEDPRPADVTQADIFHNGVRLGLKA